MTTLLTSLQNLGFDPRKISTADGGEYSSGCPACGDGGKGKKSDRFHIWPEKPQKLCVGRFWCRQCGVIGDSIAFLQQFHNMDFRAACVELGVNLPNNKGGGFKRFQPSAELPAGVSGWQPRSYPYPQALWQGKARALLVKCQDRLFLDGDGEYLRWLADRGITAHMAEVYGLGYNLSSKNGDRYRPRKSWGLPEKKGDNGQGRRLWIPQGWVIPAFDEADNLIQLRIRRRPEDIEKFCQRIKYLPLDGSSMATMVLHPGADVFVVVECGFDAILIAGLFDGKVGAITTWNVSARPDRRVHWILSASSLILNGLDYDNAGNKEQAWWNGVYKQNRRLPQPLTGVEDPGEAFAAGVDIRSWIIDALPMGLKIKLGLDQKIKLPSETSSPEPATKLPKTETISPENEPPVVTEIELTNGKIIYVTDDQVEWQALTDQGKPVFSRNELERLKAATATMNAADRLAAAMKVIDVKEVFGGYISKGENYGR